VETDPTPFPIEEEEEEPAGPDQTAVGISPASRGGEGDSTAESARVPDGGNAVSDNQLRPKATDAAESQPKTAPLADAVSTSGSATTAGVDASQDDADCQPREEDERRSSIVVSGANGVSMPFAITGRDSSHSRPGSVRLPADLEEENEGEGDDVEDGEEELGSEPTDGERESGESAENTGVEEGNAIVANQASTHKGKAPALSMSKIDGHRQRVHRLDGPGPAASAHLNDGDEL
jgi:hypothetical protein